MTQRPVQQVLDQTLLDLEGEIGNRGKAPASQPQRKSLFGLFPFVDQLWHRILFGPSETQEMVSRRQHYETRYTPPPPTNERSSLRVEPNVAAALSYIGIVGLVVFLLEKESRFVRFHAMQSILYSVAWLVLMIVLLVMNAIIAIIAGVAGDPGLGNLMSVISLVTWLVVPLLYVVGMILLAVKAYLGETLELPIVGSIAKKTAPASY